MRTNLFLIGSLFSLSLLSAQETPTEKNTSTFDKWSIDIGGGVNKTSRFHTAGYGSDNPNFYSLDLGVRHMINDKFGLRLGFGYSNIEENEGTPDFETQFYRGSFEGILNVGNLADFKSTWAKYFGLLVHAGAGIGVNNLQSPTDTEDWAGHFIAGITPQVKLSDRIGLYLDLSVLANVSQDLAWDGASSGSGEFLDGRLTTATIGLNIGLGKNGTHADWYDAPKNTDEIDELRLRLQQLELKLEDPDGDSVADWYDKEKNTPTGALVNTSGVSIDKNGNNVDDAVENYVDNSIKSNLKTTITGETGIIDKLISDGYIAIFFETNSTNPTKLSAESLQFLLQYLNDNPSASGTLTGYADERGTASYNQNLSRNRAEKVKQILVDSGINASRLQINGAGEKASANTTGSLQLNRKVVFKIN